MPSFAQRSFAGGEIGPELAGRADQAKYQTGLARCRNFIVQRFGGVTNRAGTTFLGLSHYGYVNPGMTGSRYIRFVASTTAAYALELGDRTLRIIRLGAVLTCGTPSAYAAGTTYNQGDLVTFGGVTYYSQVAANKGNQPDVSPSQWFAVPASSVAGALVVPTPWGIADVRALQVAESADVMTVVHPGYPPQEIRRYSDTRWTVAPAIFAPGTAAPATCSVTAGAGGGLSFRYRVTAIDATTGEESLAAQGVPKAISAATRANPCVITVPGHGYGNGDEVALSGLAGMTELNGSSYSVANQTTDTFELLGVDSSAYGTYVTPGVAALLAAGQPISAASNANPCVVTCYGHGYSNGDTVYVSGVAGMTQLNGNVYTIAVVDPDNFQLVGVNSTAYGVYTALGTVARLAVGKVIRAATRANPCVITVTAHGFANGSSVRISGAGGMTQLNGNVYTVANATANTFQLAGVDASGYGTYIAPGTLALTYARVDGAATPSSGAPHTVMWDTVPGAQSYNVYKYSNGVFGFIGMAIGTTFADINYGPVTTDVPPTFRNPFNKPGAYPAVVAYYQQRLVFGNTISRPETIEASRTGTYNNFSKSVPTQSDDAITWTMAGREVAPIRHLLEIGGLIVLTDSSEWTVQGDSDGTLTPTAINPRQQGFTGASSVPPVIIQNSAVFVQARGSIVRDLRYDFQVQGYQGRDLTVYAPHLFDGFSLVAMGYAQNPHSVVWAVRSDGVLLGLTYLREHEVWCWHWHDTDGKFLDVAAVPEGSEDVVYVLTSRVVNGVVRECVERMNSRRVTDPAVDAHFVDCGITQDGRNPYGTTLTLSGGTTWVFSETLTLTASAAVFDLSNVGNAFVITAADGSQLTITVNGFTSGTVVTGTANRTVPAAVRNVASAQWAYASAVVSGLAHLEGRTVAVLADGNVRPSAVVSGGRITLDRPYSVVHVGLPYTAQVQLLNYEQAQAETLIDHVKSLARVVVLVKDTRGLFAGVAGGGAAGGALREVKPASPTGYNQALGAVTGTLDVNIDSTLARSAQVILEQRDPLPATILTVIPRGELGGS